MGSWTISWGAGRPNQPESLPGSLDEFIDENPNMLYLSTLSEAAQEEWLIGSGECLNIADLSLPFDLIVYAEAVSDLENSIITDKRFSASKDLWSDCMARAGYHIDEMSDIPDFLLENVAKQHGLSLVDLLLGVDLLGSADVAQVEAAEKVVASARELEIAIARRDLECYGEVAPDLDVALQEIEQKFLDENLELMESYALAYSGA